jgi:hypothetical protein
MPKNMTFRHVEVFAFSGKIIRFADLFICRQKSRIFNQERENPDSVSNTLNVYFTSLRN